MSHEKMTRYSILPRDRFFVKGYVFLSFAKNISTNTSYKVSGKNCEKLADHHKQSAKEEVLKTTSKRQLKKKQK